MATFTNPQKTNEFVLLCPSQIIDKVVLVHVCFCVCAITWGWGSVSPPCHCRWRGDVVVNWPFHSCHFMINGSSWWASVGEGLTEFLQSQRGRECCTAALPTAKLVADVADSPECAMRGLYFDWLSKIWMVWLQLKEVGRSLVQSSWDFALDFLKITCQRNDVSPVSAMTP